MQHPSFLKMDKRLQTVASLFPVCDIAADIGADHGLLSYYLLADNICKSMLVSDISPFSLKKAQQHLAAFEKDNRVTFALSDGLTCVTNPLDVIAICGMGGKTIAQMMPDAGLLPGNPLFILSAHTQLPLLRRSLYAAGFYIMDETICLSAGRFYHVLRALKGKRNVTERQINIGINLTAHDENTLEHYYAWRIAVESEKMPTPKQVICWLKEARDTCSV